MDIPVRKNIAILSTPPTFVGERLCPLGLVPIGILKLVAFLKNRGNHVSYINMHFGNMPDKLSVAQPEGTCQWKEKPLGAEGGRKARMLISGRSFEYFAQRLKSLEKKPHEIWISCSFAFDYDLVKEYISIARKIYPAARIMVGGDFVRTETGLAKKAGADGFCSERILEADSCVPDFSSERSWEYGLFQLELGCVNKCSFCAISMDRPQKFDVDAVLGYMKKFYDKHHPSKFWNWDPNVALYPAQLEDFLDKYAASGMNATLDFGKGLQPNLVTEKLLKKMALAGATATLPMECAKYSVTRRLNKPYTIISSIKLLDMAKRNGIKMSECRCTSLLGYPDDDFNSFFRIYIATLKFGAVPSPFPVYLFPGSPDYKQYFDLIKHKDLSELHGQLWPLLPEKDLDKYINFFRFVQQTDITNIKKNLTLLSPDLKAVLLKELENSDRFVDLCLNTKKDTLDEFRKIEEEITRKKIKKTKNILYIVANPAPLGKSVSRQLGEHFIKTCKKADPLTKVTVVDLYQEGLTFITQEYVDIVYYKDGKKDISPETRNLIVLVEKYIKQLRGADEVVIVPPMYTLSIPAILKAYFEMIASRLYYFYDGKMLEPKPVLCILSRDGVYPPGGELSAPGFIYPNVQEALLSAAVSFLGLARKIKVIAASGLGEKENIPQILAKAKSEIEEHVAGSK